MTVLLRYAAHGVGETVEWRQEEIEARLGAPLTFVGALPEADAFIVATRERVGPLNVACARRPDAFHKAAHGDIVVLASDEAGREVDLDVARVLALLAPDADEASADDATVADPLV